MQVVEVKDRAGLNRALQVAKPGTQILLAPGDYPDGFYAKDLHGKADAPIVIAGADPKRPPRLIGGSAGLNIDDATYLEIRDLIIEKSRSNGINLSDGATFDTPAHHITLRNIVVRSVGSGGNEDGIKLSGLDQFTLENCVVERCSRGGSGIDMVGCHDGQIIGCTFQNGGSNGVQMKGGTARVVVRSCSFTEVGDRGVNIGGSTGMPFFRPQGVKYEAKEITVEDCLFTGSNAAVAFVGVDGATVRRCRILRPGRWAIRILQETRAAGFVPCRNGVFEENQILFRSDRWSEGGVNIGGGTAPETFRFRRNRWYCEDNPTRSQPKLPTPEDGGIYGEPVRNA